MLCITKDYSSCSDCESSRYPKQKNYRLAELHYTIYAPAASTVIQQFLKPFLTPFRSFQLHQTVFIYQREFSEQHAVYCVSKLKIITIVWDLEFQLKQVKDANLATSMKLGIQIPNNIPQGDFSRRPEKKYFQVYFQNLTAKCLNSYGLDRFSTISVCVPAMLTS